VTADREPGPEAARPLPRPLLVAAAITALEGVAMLVYGVLELVNLADGRVAMGLTTTAFFGLYGAGLLALALALTRGRSWARAPVVGTQLILLGTAWSFRGGDTTWVFVLVSALALVTVLGLLLPESRAALSADEG